MLDDTMIKTACLSLVLAFVAWAPAQTSSPALTGTVSSQAEGPMEGVLVGAKRNASTVATWVVTNARGEYSFPRDRVQPGEYGISIRAVGYELAKTSIDVTTQTAHLDLHLEKVTHSSKLAMQLSN